MQPACLEEEEGGVIQHAPQEQLVQPSAWGRRSNHNLKLLEDGLTVTYQPAPFPLIAVAQADRPFSQLQGLCYFEVVLADVGKSQQLNSVYDRDLAIGLATRAHPLDCHLGSSNKYASSLTPVLALAAVVLTPDNNWPLSYRSYGLHCSDYSTQFKGGKKLVYVPARSLARMWTVVWWPGTVPALKSGDVVGCGFHNTTHDIFFTHNGKALPGALQRIYGELYPTVTVCSNGARFTARFKPPFAYSISLNWAPPELVDYMPRELDPLACGSSLKLHEANTVVEYTNSHDGINGLVLADHPFNPTQKVSYFEMEVVDRGQKGWIAIGLSVFDYPLTHHPGWRRGSWGYHGDDGRKFGESGTGEPFGPSYTTGDVIGVGLHHQRKELFFTKNGFFLGVGFVGITEDILFPSVGLHSYGEKVRAWLLRSERPKRQQHFPDFRAWTPEQVGQWLESTVGLGQYQKKFVENDITGETLESLGDSDVLKKELGITSFGHRMQIVKHIQGLLSKDQQEGGSGSSLSDREDSTGRERSSSSGSREGSGSFSPRPSLPDERAMSRVEVKYEDLEMGECIGKGFFGEVRRARWQGTDVAVKVIYRKSFRSADEFQLFEKEVAVLSLLRHPCIVQFMGVCVGSKNCIVTEFMAGGNLESFVLLKLAVLEHNPYLRLDKHLGAKVADFGLSRLKGENRMTEGVGFLPFQAPEVFKGEEYSEQADVYSFGMVVWFLFAGKQPDEGFASALRMANMVAHKDYRPALPDGSRPSFRELLRTIEHYKQSENHSSGYFVPNDPIATDRPPAPKYSRSEPSLESLYYYESEGEHTTASGSWESRRSSATPSHHPAHHQRAVNSAPLVRRSVENSAAGEDNDEELAAAVGHMRVRDAYHHYSEGDCISTECGSQSENEALFHHHHGPFDQHSPGGEEGDIIAARLFGPTPPQ
ncbi:Dual specificity protein kinase [Acanthamoeba castellanii str. Neff]|uniref:Dual specificity protein kinase n=1 Tax=Acanthamoeba castellanii (strain ATCC 30010 / Neff) TaxID=1257118 RepID=L8HDC3_ACACF|nr:Dual specificity protein kinase [Acanthamoeba castellanii str. Neff]ELR23232.1 Dual specificity protein kinase [Acanthamoeba castellanii str. Neff]